MNPKHGLRLVLFVVLMLTACKAAAPQIITQEVTRVVQVTVPVVNTVQVPVEVTRVVKETVIVTPTATALPVSITQWPSLETPRTRHTATPLLNGKVLVVGGSLTPNIQVADVELFDPAANSIKRVASLHTPRHQHTATLLMDGRVLVVGGYNNFPPGWVTDAEVYDPTLDTWTVLPPSNPHGVNHTATLMRDGRVLVVGGCTGGGNCTERVDIFNPQDDTWTVAKSLDSDRASHSAVLLDNGRVLVIGGGAMDGAPAGGDALLYDPSTNSWSPTGDMITPRMFTQAVWLPFGRVLVAGGAALEEEPSNIILASAEIYNPITNEWTAAADMAQARYWHSLVLLPGGQALTLGGARDLDYEFSESSFVSEMELYDFLADQWVPVGVLPMPKVCATATALTGNQVWVAGGQVLDTSYSDTWLIDVHTNDFIH